VFPNVRYRGIAVDNGVRHIEIYFKGRVAITQLDDVNNLMMGYDDTIQAIINTIVSSSSVVWRNGVKL
jgi:ArsR family metal-binding transcriptional regulator